MARTIAPRTRLALLVASVLLALIIIAAAAAGYLRRTEPWRRDRPNCPICTQMVAQTVHFYALRYSGWYPASSRGEYPALSLSVPGSGTGCVFATYRTAEEQVKYYAKHGVLSQEICPYRYIQGLREDDPSDLIVMYTKTRTRWKNHIYPEGYAPVSHWLVMAPDPWGHWDTGDGSDKPGGWLDTPEFKRRLEKTLSFLRENKRPYWEETVRTHQDFLRSLKDVD